MQKFIFRTKKIMATSINSRFLTLSQKSSLFNFLMLFVLSGLRPSCSRSADQTSLLCSRLIATLGILLFVSRSQCPHCSLPPRSNLLQIIPKIARNKFIEVAIFFSATAHSQRLASAQQPAQHRAEIQPNEPTAAATKNI